MIVVASIRYPLHRIQVIREFKSMHLAFPLKSTEVGLDGILDGEVEHKKKFDLSKKEIRVKHKVLDGIRHENTMETWSSDPHMSSILRLVCLVTCHECHPLQRSSDRSQSPNC